MVEIVCNKAETIEKWLLSDASHQHGTGLNTSKVVTMITRTLGSSTFFPQYQNFMESLLTWVNYYNTFFVQLYLQARFWIFSSVSFQILLYLPVIQKLGEVFYKWLTAKAQHIWYCMQSTFLMYWLVHISPKVIYTLKLSPICFLKREDRRHSRFFSLFSFCTVNLAFTHHRPLSSSQTRRYHPGTFWCLCLSR